jgi:hypothetical protein
MSAKSCPRCKGTMSMEFDVHIRHYWCCLNCGHTEYLSDALFIWSLQKKRWVCR